MKTEKRLTMALSVLVALMMLAVPLASSSNLFVDGGQTNSNGDAPLLAAEGTYILYFDYAAPANSLDEVVLDGSLDQTASALTGAVEFSLVKGETTQDNRILAYVKQTASNDVTIGKVIEELNKLLTRTGYDLVSWKGTDSNTYDSSDSTPVSKNMTYTANWELSSVNAYVKNADVEGDGASEADFSNVTYDYKEFKVNVTIDGETKEYIKAYLVTEDADGNQIVEFDFKLITSLEESGSFKVVTTDFTQIRLGEDEIAGIGSNGFVLTKSEAGVGTWDYAPVYDVHTTDSNKKVIYDSTKAQKTVNSVSGDSQNSFNVNFELQSTITKITISSILFDEDLEVFVYDYTTLSYNMLLEFLMTFDDNTITPTSEIPKDLELPFIKDGGDFIPSTGEWPVNKDKYVLTSWDGSVPLKSQDKITGTSVTLDARTNVYNVIFMVNGECEVVEVTFGTELSANLTKLDVSGVDHWVTPVNGGKYTSESFNKFTPFRFSPAEIKNAESLGAGIDGAAAKPFILIACFQPANKTAYAVFNAGANADFGNELVTTIVIPGEINTPISQTPSAPVKEGKNIFIGWETKNYTGSDEDGWTYTSTGTTPIGYSSSQEYSTKDVVSKYDAKIETYKWTISFSVDGSVIGTLYYAQGTSNTITLSILTAGLVAYQYDGKMYKADDVGNGTNAAKDAFANIVSPFKAGYEFEQWNDADGNKVISGVDVSKIGDTKYRKYVSSTLSIEKLTGDLTVYAEFEAREYKIAYNNSLGDSQIQNGIYVDETVTLFGEVFLNENFKLLGWTTTAGGSQVEYQLGGNFVLSGADYEKLVEKNEGTVMLYSVWEKVGSGSGTGGNTGGDNDNTALYLIAGMLAVIAILAIVGILLMRRK